MKLTKRAIEVQSDKYFVTIEQDDKKYWLFVQTNHGETESFEGELVDFENIALGIQRAIMEIAK